MSDAEKEVNVSRRGFIVAGAAAVAGAALPVQAMAGGGKEAESGWFLPAGTALGSILRAYTREMTGFAESLRPRFESGEFRAFRDADGEAYAHGEGTPWRDMPHGRLELECAAFFGLEVERGENYHYEGDYVSAHLILAVSPHAEATADTQEHPCFHASEAIAWDVIALARERGWYTPTPDECEDPIKDLARLRAA